MWAVKVVTPTGEEGFYPNDRTHAPCHRSLEYARLYPTPRGAQLRVKELDKDRAFWLKRQPALPAWCVVSATPVEVEVKLK